MTVRHRTSTPVLGEFARGLRAQVRPLRPVMLLIYTPVVLALGTLVLVRVLTGIAIADFTVDPLIVVGGAPVYTGIVATAGGLVWAGTAAVCFFSYVVTRGPAGRSADDRFLLAGGCVTLMVLLDDVYLFHEIVYPRYLGVPQPVVYGVYALVLLWFLRSFRSTILQTDFLLLAMALAGFGLSVGLDLTARVNPFPAQYLFEDGAKLVGLVSWAAYFVLASARHVRSARDPRGETRSAPTPERGLGTPVPTGS